MKIKVGKDSLFEGLQRVFSVIPQKPTLPVLANFHLSVSGGKLYISGTDMDIAITTSIASEVKEEGGITVNAKLFMSIIRELPAGDIEINVDDERVGIVFAKGETTLMGMPVSNYPAVRNTLDGAEIKIDGESLVEMVEKTSFSAASADRSRIALTGVFWRVGSGKTMMVATDGHRLALIEKKTGEDAENKDETNSEIIIHPKTLSHATRIFSSGEKLEKIVFGEKAILFIFSDTVIFSKLIEGPYPNFMQVIPQNNTKKVVFPTEELSSTIRRVSIVSNSVSHQIRISLSPGSVEISTSDTETGNEAHESIPVIYDGDPLVAGYNSSFLLEILRRIDSDNVRLELEMPNSACLLKPDDAEDNSNIYLIMPLRLSE